MQNVDEKELAKFEMLAHEWWDTESKFKPLHDINPLRLQYIENKAGLAGKKVLDVGCGGGILSEAMAAKGAEVHGIDMGEAPLAVARIHAMESQIEVNYRLITAEELVATEKESYDIVTCLEVLEHVPDPKSLIKACSDLLKPEGHAFFATINRNPKSFLFAIVGAEYVLNLLPKGTHDYKNFIKPSELAHWARDAELMVRDMTGMVYNPFTQKYSLENKDLAVNYLIWSQKT